MKFVQCFPKRSIFYIKALFISMSLKYLPHNLAINSKSLVTKWAMFILTKTGNVSSHWIWCVYIVKRLDLSLTWFWPRSDKTLPSSSVQLLQIKDPAGSSDVPWPDLIILESKELIPTTQPVPCWLICLSENSPRIFKLGVQS